jgi:RimJ/RimL family protein N-acetyltransferase
MAVSDAQGISEAAGDSRASLRLVDGTVVQLRFLQSSDQVLFEHNWRSLSPSSRYRRFHKVFDDLPDEYWAAFFTGVDQDRHLVLVLEAGEDLVGACRLVRYDHDWHTADLAVTVLDRWQGKGAGSLLAREILRIAEDVHTIDTTVLADNSAAVSLLERIGAVTVACSSGTCDARVLVSRPIPA